MWDLTEQVAPICETARNYSVEVDGQRVTFGPTPYRRYQHDWECSCPAFDEVTYCAHVTEARQQRCGWNSHLEPYPTPPGARCPDCGGPLAYVKVGV